MSVGKVDLNRRALEPARSVVIEACAGSGKTWLLVSRIVRLLLSGVAPSQILAITFTRKAANEMAARLRGWLRELAAADESTARKFLLDREVDQTEIEALLPRARDIYEQFLTAQPPLTITTFHSWFLQLLRRAPLDAAVLGDAALVEQTHGLMMDAWQQFAVEVQRDRTSAAARGLDALFARYRLHNTRTLLSSFVARRADWWAYTRGKSDPVAYALDGLRQNMSGLDEDMAGSLFMDKQFLAQLGEYAQLLERNNTASDRAYADSLRGALGALHPALHFSSICTVFFKLDGEARERVPRATTAKRLGIEGERRLLDLHAQLCGRLAEVRKKLADQDTYRLNEAGLAAGAALLDVYQRIKRERRIIDFADVEWLTYELVANSEHAAYMQYKLDARYRHILIDEFQDTNPLQWLTLDAWLSAAEAADARPTVFVVGDPKQSIYRFRGAEARLFWRLRDYLSVSYSADAGLRQDISRRCAKPIIELVNRLFAHDPEFQQHTAHNTAKRGRVEILPLIGKQNNGRGANLPQGMRDPLVSPLLKEEDRRREIEAQQFVDRVQGIVGCWEILDENGRPRRARYQDIMVLVRRRTHLEVYEHALRRARIPFVTSRQGGLLDTLEAQDLIALLQFLVAPFENLKLAHVLRSPLFSCSDSDLALLAESDAGSWWERLMLLRAQLTPELQRAHDLLSGWLERADALPVHDQLDRIYFEADAERRYQAAVPQALQGSVAANLRAFMQRALDTDSGRYPSLPRFLHEVGALRDAPQQEAPDEGVISDAADAIRILTVHGAKGLESPIIWLLDSAAGVDNEHAYAMMVDWPPDAPAPAHMSLRSTVRERCEYHERLLAAQSELAQTEDTNLLYVAVTRAKQALIVSGSEWQRPDNSWYMRIRRAIGPPDTTPDMPVQTGQDLNVPGPSAAAEPQKTPVQAVIGLTSPFAVGTRKALVTGRGQRYGSQFHALMDRLTSDEPPTPDQLLRELGLSERELAPLLKQAQGLLHNPTLARFFDAKAFISAANEVPLVFGNGELRRIDRLVEFENEIWVLDYKTGALKDAQDLTRKYEQQVIEYREAMRSIYPQHQIKAAIVFADAGVVYVD